MLAKPAVADVAYIGRVNTQQPVLILGAGINGAALARELALNGVPVVVVDTADVAFGATSYSSRLIHGGIRYLEYGEFDLVRESLGERNRLLILAPHLVRELRLFIPVRKRFGGLVTSARRFLGWERKRRPGEPAPERGQWLVDLGLWMYDRYSKLANAKEKGRLEQPYFPQRETHDVGEPGTPRVNPQRYRWLCSYSDGQVRFPERFTLALFEDARQLAAAAGVRFELLTYHRATLAGRDVRIESVAGQYESPPAFQPAAIINATGAWVDFTLQSLAVPARKMMGGTKGSHFFTHHQGLREALQGEAIYAEAIDGRPVFVLPFGDATLVGTTDIPFTERPETAVASDKELDYLVDTVNSIVADVRLTRGDIAWHYSGVRPLPAVDAATPSAVTRRHWLEEHREAPLPLYSIIGGKLTTCRSLAEEAAATILTRLGLPVRANSRERYLPGGDNYPRREGSLLSEQKTLADSHNLSMNQVAAMWKLCGTQIRDVLAGQGAWSGRSLAGTNLPIEFCRWSIDHEWVARLDDLVERRLMLLYEPGLCRATLDELADLLIVAGHLASPNKEAEITRVVTRLQAHFGRSLS